MKLDRTDRTILAELQRDGRLTNRELAEKVRQTALIHRDDGRWAGLGVERDEVERDPSAG